MPNYARSNSLIHAIKYDVGIGEKVFLDVFAKFQAGVFNFEVAPFFAPRVAPQFFRSNVKLLPSARAKSNPLERRRARRAAFQKFWQS